MMSGLTQEEKQLAILMSQISEKCYSAGWIKNLEYVLWSTVASGPRRFGHDFITQEEINEMIKFSKITGSWIVFDDDREETSIKLETWKVIFEEKWPTLQAFEY